uniref:Uncharacterized protein n=1 Tax=Avena sativa TaxID=4498 RepID=A0ACD5YZ94_AVESA
MASISSSLALPCLAFHRAADRSTVLYSVPEKKRIAAGADTDDDVLADKTILPTARGYVLAHGTTTFLYSPQSRRKIDLPPLDIDQDLLVDYNCLLSDDPAAPGCVVLLVELDALFIWYHRIGGADGGEWHEHEYDIGSQQYDPADSTLLEKSVITPIAACRGRFYFNPLDEMGVIDFSSTTPDTGTGPAFSSIAAGSVSDEESGSPRGQTSVDFLVESEGELYMVSLLFAVTGLRTVTGASVQVMDFESSRWRGVGDLGGRAFVLSMYNFGASCESGGEAGLRGDCVYVAYPVAKKLLVFDVKDGSMESVKLDDAPESDKAFWVLPRTCLVRHFVTQPVYSVIR